MSNSSELKVKKIMNGTVIDHIPSGRALDILKIIRITGKEGNVVLIAMNVESRKLGKKDIIKIENRYLFKDELNLIALVAPNATINIVKNYDVIEKIKVELPEKFEGILKCHNPSCITNYERESLSPKFLVEDKVKLTLRCFYCGRSMFISDVLKQLA
jgi:aspartate carbamoyltransferase regulatory subunit